mmetsp:Transcript_68394/g.137542  ORF Transcript_68394/g.137542 Transcript_68394/m.137542 type:complete len:333 (+) Transcript_68394:36-1034(+)
MMPVCPNQLRRKPKTLKLIVGALLLLAQAVAPDEFGNGFDRLPDDFYTDLDGTALSAGFHHTCALEMRTNIEFGGALRCWGFNDHGQAAPPSGHFIQVSSGHLFSCGVRVDETVQCWGLQSQPPLDAGLFLQISAGEFHVCGITKESSVRCWGGHVPSAVTPPPGQFVQVSSGKDFTCALSRDGTAVCWGDPKKGKTRPPNGVQFKQLSASPYSHYACGLTLDAGDILCWGEKNSNGGYSSNRLGPFTQVSSGNRQTCGIRAGDGHVECWGVSTRMDDTSKHGSTERHGWEQISSGSQHTCGINSDSEVVCWGAQFDSEQNVAGVPDGFVVA